MNPTPPEYRPLQDKLPTFPKVMAIVCLAFAVIRGLLGLFGIVGVAMIAREGADVGNLTNNFVVGIAEVVTALFVAVFGIVANILLLGKKQAAIPLGWLMVVFSILSIGVGVATVSLQLLEMTGGEPDFARPEVIGMMVGAGVMLMIRVLILTAYIVALILFARWMRARQVWAAGMN